MSAHSAVASPPSAVSKAEKTEGHDERVYRAMFTADGKTVVTAGRDAVRFWNATDGALQSKLTAPAEEQFSFIDLRPDGLQLATSSRTGAIRLWDLPAGKVTAVLPGHPDRTYCLSYFDGGKRLFSCGVDKLARVWDLSTGKEMHVLRGHTERILSHAIRPDHKVAATGGDDESIRLWDLTRGEALATLTNTGSVQALAFSPDGKQLAAAGKNAVVRVWTVLK